MKKILPTVSDLFSPVQEWEEHLRVNPILKFRVAEGHEKFQRVYKQIFFSRVNRRKKKSRTFVGEIFFTKRETIILTECFYRRIWLPIIWELFLFVFPTEIERKGKNAGRSGIFLNLESWTGVCPSVPSVWMLLTHVAGSLDYNLQQQSEILIFIWSQARKL